MWEYLYVQRVREQKDLSWKPSLIVLILHRDLLFVPVTPQMNLENTGKKHSLI